MSASLNISLLWMNPRLVMNPSRSVTAVVAHALVRAASTLVSTPGGYSTKCSHECEHGTHECLRYS